ncbi:MAG: aminoglycoside adenylyltransferase domain-containing protein [Candidatus Promineifilaceae bacterium]
MSNKINPTPEPEINNVLREFSTRIQETLGRNFVAVYLQGSLASGGWDEHSDVDFLVVTEHDLTSAEVGAVNAMHAEIFKMESRWAKHLDGSYISRTLVRAEDPAHTPIYYLDNGSTELKRSPHDNTLVVRWMILESGITLAGPPPETLIDPVSADSLRREVRQTMQVWGEEILTGEYQIDNRWAQPFAVISYCRMLQTVESGRIHSKRAGYEWAIQNLDPKWCPLIKRAWAERPNPGRKASQPANTAEQQLTRDFIRYALLIS